MEAARKPDDSRLAELVGELSIRDEQFRQWWAGTHVASREEARHTDVQPVGFKNSVMLSNPADLQRDRVYEPYARLEGVSTSSSCRSSGRGASFG